MADTDLAVVIRQLARQQRTALAAAVKARRDHYRALAAKATTPAARQRFKHLATEAAAHGAAAMKRLQMSADNAADAYARAMRKSVEAAAVAATRPPAKTKKPTTSPDVS